MKFGIKNTKLNPKDNKSETHAYNSIYKNPIMW
jgi:hypothetical protein